MSRLRLICWGKCFTETLVRTTQNVKETNYMTLKNAKLITVVTELGEDKILELLGKKLDDDLARREYHRKYNARKNEILRSVKATHPELFKTVGV